MIGEKDSSAVEPRGYASLAKFLTGILLMSCGAGSILSQAPQKDLTSSRMWDSKQSLPFSFKYGGRESAEIVSQWNESETTESSARSSTQGKIHVYSYVDPQTQLRVTAEVRLYPEFPGAIDWVLKFRNDGTADTPIIEDILPLNLAIPASSGESIVHHDRGSQSQVGDFTPLDEHLDRGGKLHLESYQGDSSNHDTMPFFNLQNGGGGVIGAIGWTGDWKADFTYSADGKAIAITAGMKKTHLLLHPGEEIRTPRIVLMSWTGHEWLDAQNKWRQLLLAHYTPQENGTHKPGPILFGSWGSEPIDDKLAYIRWVHDHRIPVEVYAVDAGWYGASVGAEMDTTNPWWKNRGDWFPSPLYYPHGIKPLGDALKADGFGFSLWIETETTMQGKKIIKDHPDWFLHIDPSLDKGESLVNLGSPVARQGVTDMVSGFISNFGMTWYRQDFNVRPYRYWAAADTPDRIGMTEIGYIEGLYRMLDDLLKRHPGLRIDNCASGGRRIDIEMMSRSFVVWRTDLGFINTLAEQAQTQALAPWVPDTMGFESLTQSKPWTKPGPYSTPRNLYLMRLGYDAGYGTTPGAAGVDNEEWVKWIKQAIAEYREVQPYIYGDFYALQPYSLSDDVWTAWQWDRPKSKDGLVIVLRRPASSSASKQLDLQHLDLKATYHVEIRTCYDKAPAVKMTGNSLAHLQVQLADAPSSELVFYRLIQKR
jgi:alpha-galactosidase